MKPPPPVEYGEYLGSVEVRGWDPPSLNGPGGLIRMHWATRRRKKNALVNRLGAMQGLPEITCPVHVVYNRFGAKRLDQDNLASSSNLPLNALRAAGVIPDDDPDTVKSLTCVQECPTFPGFRIDFYKA